MFHPLFVVVAGRERAEPLKIQVSIRVPGFGIGLLGPRDKIRSDDMRRHCDCMVPAFYLH